MYAAFRSSQAASASMDPLRFIRGRLPLLLTDTSIGIEGGGEEEVDDEANSFLFLLAL